MPSFIWFHPTRSGLRLRLRPGAVLPAEPNHFSLQTVASGTALPPSPQTTQQELKQHFSSARKQPSKNLNSSNPCSRKFQGEVFVAGISGLAPCSARCKERSKTQDSRQQEPNRQQPFGDWRKIPSPGNSLVVYSISWEHWNSIVLDSADNSDLFIIAILF